MGKMKRKKKSLMLWLHAMIKIIAAKLNQAQKNTHKMQIKWKSEKEMEMQTSNEYIQENKKQIGNSTWLEALIANYNGAD